MLVRRLHVTALVALACVVCASCRGSVIFPAESESDGAGTGGRTQLATTAASGPAGGGGGAGSGGAGVSEPVPPPPCTQLVQTGALSRLPFLPMTLSFSQPTLVSLGNGSMAIVRTIAIPGTGPQNTVTSNVAWTGAWPPVASEPVELAPRPWYIATDSPRAQSRIALLGTPEDGARGIAFGFADALTGGWSQLVLADSEGSAPSFVAANERGDFFIGMAARAAIPNNADLRVGWVATTDGTSYVGPIEVGCPANPAAAAAAATPTGWLMARALFENCMAPKGRIEVTVYDGQSATQGATFPGDPYADVDLVPHADGAWLLFDSLGSSAVRLDALGAVVVGPLAISPGSTGLVADALDGGLVFAAAHHDETDLTVGVTDDHGDIIASALLALPFELASWEFQIAFDNGTRQVLVALINWTDATASFEDSIHVARFSCQ